MKRFDIHLDTDRVVNPGCRRCPRAEERHTDKDGLCQTIQSATDGLPIRCVGNWANDKIYYLLQYFQIFTQGMYKKWGKLRYVEVCSGPGRCCTRDGYEQNGTALSIVKKPLFDLLADAIFIDYSHRVVDVLAKRFAAAGKTDRVHAIVGDYNDSDSIVRALGEFSPDSLTLCFIDPTDCSLPFDTVKRIFQATHGKCDFLISFFDGLDFHRNGVQATLKGPHAESQKKYARFLDTPDFFARKEVVEAAQANKPSELSWLFRKQYAQNLGDIGLPFQDWKSVKNYYDLLYASSHPTGLAFWKKATKYDSAGQAEFNWETVP